MKDPRHFQIISLIVLLTLQIFWADFGPYFPVVALTLGTAILCQLIFMKLLTGGISKTDLRSPLLSGMSLCILLRAETWWILPLAGFIAIASKFIIRIDDKHIFNPSAIAIVFMLLLFPQSAWVSPGQWGSHIWLIFLLASLAFLVLYRIKKADISLFFLGSFAALIFARALYLGDPLAIPLHQIQSGALLIFAFFMISDPKTTPDHHVGRFVFALAIAVTGFILQFEFHIREGLFYALVFISVATPLLDKLMQAPRYEWENKRRAT